MKLPWKRRSHIKLKRVTLELDFSYSDMQEPAWLPKKVYVGNLTKAVTGLLEMAVWDPEGVSVPSEPDYGSEEADDKRPRNSGPRLYLVK